ncbi:hypothetical protein PsYK624_046110 [Phanerochaete sordida]|uniref:Uncharacterized protein n=1 Tax=Phanerochaete sordida TaxID=48140 RepID=A0A9P3LBW6_9APHY|nr:hypothetical protein PsYK624_046110 [Phanerochaete sordida]
MDSPEPSSPISRSSSDSPIPEEPPYMLSSEPPAFTSTARPESIFSSGKRRLMGGASSSTAKSRRREEGSSRRAPASNAWPQTELRDYGGGGRAQREELVDQQLVDKIRQEWGDPFDETAVKSAS